MQSRAVPVITSRLCDSFAEAADALSMRKAGRIPELAIDDFIALGWMDWHGGSPSITALGKMALVRIRARFVGAVA